MTKSAELRVKPPAVPASIPCTHGKKDICDVCLVWCGVEALAHSRSPRLWMCNAEFIVTVECLNHGVPRAVEVAWDKDAFRAIEKAYRKLDREGAKLSCGCRFLNEVLR